MSRSLLILVAAILVLVAGVALLSTVDTEVAPSRVEKPVANEAGGE